MFLFSFVLISLYKCVTVVSYTNKTKLLKESLVKEITTIINRGELDHLIENGLGFNLTYDTNDTSISINITFKNLHQDNLYEEIHYYSNNYISKTNLENPHYFFECRYKNCDCRDVKLEHENEDLSDEERIKEFNKLCSNEEHESDHIYEKLDRYTLKHRFHDFYFRMRRNFKRKKSNSI